MSAEGAILGLLVQGDGSVPSGSSEGLVGSSGKGTGTHHHDEEIVEVLSSATDGFDDSIHRRVESIAEETESDGLRKVASNWDSVSEEIDGYSVGFEDEKAAVDWLVGKMTDIGVGLDEEEEEKLREAVSEEYADAVEIFRKRIEDDATLERSIRMSTRKDAVRRLNGMADRFRRLSGRRPYTLYELPEGNELLPGHEDAFENPEDIAEHYERVIEENPEDAEAHNNYAVLLHERLDETEKASEHYKEAIETNPRLAEAQYNYGVLLLNSGRTEKSRERLEMSASLWMEREEFGNALHVLRRLVETCLDTGDEDGVVEYSESGLKILNSVSEHRENEIEEEQRWFGTVRMLTRPDDVKTQDLHANALLNAKLSKSDEAVQLFEMAWERQERHDDESEIGEYRASVASGVALAVYLEISDDVEASWTSDEILAKIEADDLHEAPNALYDSMTETEDSSVDAQDLKRLSEEYEEGDQNIAATEAAVFAELLEKLESSNSE